ncbi:Hypothetical predicted protein, partial [Pelobates cultripes]
HHTEFDYCVSKAHSTRYQCPARGKICKLCGKLNHFAKVCLFSCGKNVHAVNKEDTEPEEHDEMFVDSVAQSNQSPEQAFPVSKSVQNKLEYDSR